MRHSGASASPSGSRASTEPSSTVSALTGFDPSRSEDDCTFQLHPLTGRPLIGSGDFSIGGLLWPGFSKLVEECGEVAQVIGKFMGNEGRVDHWDGSNLAERLAEEMADVEAAILFVRQHNTLPDRTVRIGEKLALFNKWHREVRDAKGSFLKPYSILERRAALAGIDTSMRPGISPPDEDWFCEPCKAVNLGIRRVCRFCKQPRASAIEAATAGETPQSGSTEGESAVAKPDAHPPETSNGN